jgi:hypothetical protein
METDAANQRNWKFRRAGCAASILVLLASLFAGFIWLKNNPSEPREAPEAERVLAAQAGLPFQVLIPAYLPQPFNRKQVEIITDRSGPNGEEMIQLIYATRNGYSITLSEWIPAPLGSSATASNERRCLCICRSNTQCNMVGMELSVGLVRIKVEFSVSNLLPYDQLQLLLDTLGPAANRQVYSSVEDVPLSILVPPAVDVPVGADGVQELTLVVTPQGYSPVHFAVQQDIPVRLIFRQLGEVGCGNELIFQWGSRQSATLVLASPTDKQVLEFMPDQSGEFRFSCPHQIYRGVMTVKE